MKLVFVFMCAIMINATASVYSQNVQFTFSVEGKTIKDVFRIIEKESQFRFLYNDDFIDLNRLITIEVKESRIESILDQILDKSEITYRILNNNLIVITPVELAIQGIPVSGTITDTEGVTLPGVNVLIKGTRQGTVTDVNGAFSLTVPDENATLVFSSLGYAPQEMVVGSQRTFKVSMSEEAREIEEVVVVGYGTQKVSTLTGSVAQIKSDKLTVAPIANVTNMLAGQLPGLVTKQMSGIPGADAATLRIRSYDRDPLVIVDGMENSLQNLDPSQIETISILKDGAASIYGARAGEGVILVTTKRGAQSKPTVIINSSYTLQGSTNVIKQSESADNAEVAREEWINKNPDKPELAPFSEEDIQKYRDGTDPKYLNTNWFDESIRRYAPQQNHNMTLMGGTETIKYYGYFGYNSQETILKTNGGYYNRYNFQVNMDAKVTKRISVGMDIKYFNEKRYYPSGADGVGHNVNFWRDLIYATGRIYPLTLPDPSKFSYAGIPYGNSVWATNSELCGYQDGRNNTTVFKGDVKYDFKYIPGLYARGVAIYQYGTYNRKIAIKQAPFYTYNADIEKYSLVRLSQDPMSMSMNYSNTSRLVQQYSLNYSNTFLNAHTVSGIFLYEWQEEKYLGFDAGRSGYISMALPEFYAGDPEKTNISSGTSGMGRVSWVGRLNYVYKDRYMLETILRADASSRFAKDYRWGYFPSVSLGWNIAKENFMNNLNIFDLLKLRASYGTSGYDGVANFAYLAGYRFDGSYIFGDDFITGLVPTDMANFLLSWEEMSISNAGLDFSMWNRKLYGEFEYFYRKREGIPATRRNSLPTTFGASLPTENLNSQSTSGFELRLGTSGKVGDFSYDISGNFNYALSKLIKIDEADWVDPDEIRIYKRSGTVSDRRMGYLFDGLFTSQEEVDRWPLTFEFLNYDNSSLRPGDVKYKDLNDDGVINWRDVTEIGKGATPHGTFGFNFNLKYKGFDLTGLLQGAFDYNTSIALWYSSVDIYHKNRWHETRNNKADALVPRLGGSPTNGWGSDYHDRNTAYMRLKYLSLGYEIPAPVISKIGIERCRFYVAGTNLLTIFNTLRNFSVDPEMPEGYAAGFYYPQQFTMSVGCNLSF